MLLCEETPWGNIEVWQNENIRSLYLQDQKAIQSQLDMAQKEKLLWQYTRAMMSFLLFQGRPQSTLLLGLGGGSIIHFLTHWFPALKITAVDINEQIVKIAKDYFGLSTTPQVNIEVADAFIYLNRLKQKSVNVILVDLHDGVSHPKFLYTPSFMAHCFHALSPGGVLVINLLINSDQEFTDILVALRHSFTDISLCMKLKNQNNIVLFAFKAPTSLDQTQLQSKASHCQNKYNIEFEEFVGGIIKVDAK